jgi:hypothetical protein
MLVLLEAVALEACFASGLGFRFDSLAFFAGFFDTFSCCAMRARIAAG